MNIDMQGTRIPEKPGGYPIKTCRLLLKHVLTRKIHILEYIRVTIQLYYPALRGILRMNLSM